MSDSRCLLNRKKLEFRGKEKQNFKGIFTFYDTLETWPEKLCSLIMQPEIMQPEKLCIWRLAFCSLWTVMTIASLHSHVGTANMYGQYSPLGTCSICLHTECILPIWNWQENIFCSKYFVQFTVFSTQYQPCTWPLVGCISKLRSVVNGVSGRCRSHYRHENRCIKNNLVNFLFSFLLCPKASEPI